LIKKTISLLTAAAILFLSFTAQASADNLIQNSGFEEDELLWEAGEISDFTSSEGYNSLMLSSPLSSALAQGYPVIAEYIPEIPLAEGGMYSLSFDACSTDEEPIVPLQSSVKFSASSNRIVVEASGISNNWTHISVMFLAGKSYDYGLSLTLYSALPDSLLFIDNISITPMEFGPTEVQIEGPSEVYVPEAGYATYQYSTVMVDGNENKYPIMTGDIYAPEQLPDGVSFDPVTSSLMVESYAQPGESLTLMCTPPSGIAGLPDGSFTVTLDKNMITNGSFQHSPALSGWDASSPLTPVSDGDIRFAAVRLTPDEELGYTATLSPDKTLVFLEDTMYVLRAFVRSEDGYETRKILSPNAQVSGNRISVNISDIGGGWTEVISAITVPVQGIYDLDINIVSSDMRPIYIDNVTLRAEEVAPADVIFNAPAHIVPGGDLSFPFAFAVRDQSENIISADASVLVYPENKGVSISGNYIIVDNSAKAGTYTLKGVSNENPDAVGTHSFTVSDTAIGDGGFETSLPGHLWATSLPSEFKTVPTYADIYPHDGEKMGRLAMNGNVSVLYSDSVKKYVQGESYIFNAWAAKAVPDIETVVTVLLVDSYSMSLDDSLVVCQFELTDTDTSIQRVFTPSQSVNGKLMIAFTTPEQHDSQVILLDSISVQSAKVYATNVSIGGSPFAEMLISGRYKFSSNFDTTDASTYRWLMSSEANGVYIPISGQTSQTLTVTPDMLEKYIKFEVTPISLSGPVTGRSVMSAWVHIGYPIDSSMPEDDGFEDVENNGDTPSDPTENNTEQAPENTPAPPKGELSVIDISQFATHSADKCFVDMYGHWAEGDVNIAAAAGIVNGRGEALFYPADSITRAEFSAFLIRAFRLAPLYYEEGFDDVKPWDWYAGVVETVTHYSIAQGIGDKLFAPDLPITREQMAVMIMRAFAKTGVTIPKGSTAGFNDSKEISSWAVDAVGSAVALGIMRGTDKGAFEPQRNATRAEAIVAIKRMIEKGM